MKALLAVLCGCLTLFLSSAAFSCSDANGCMAADANPCNDDGCECADPACRQNNPCLSRSQCCEVFGNIGRLNN
jgi:hypothetical protein